MSKVELRSIKSSDLEQLYAWRNDPFIMARIRQWRKLEWSEHVKWFDNLDPNKNLMYGIFIDIGMQQKPTVKGYWEIIGVCGLINIDWVNRSCELSIYIGKEDCRRYGYGSRVITMFKKICFDQMNMHRLWAEVYSFNQSMMDMLCKNGFNIEGYLKDTVFRNGKYYNSYFYTFLEEDWKEEKGTKKLLEDEV